MELALLLVSMAAVVLAATAVSERLHVPAPLILVLVGAAASYVPGVPTIHLESEVVLLGLLPPLLYAAAIQTSLVDFNANRGTILRLSVLLVVVTSLAVAAVVEWLVPDLGWAAAIAIGAVVAPPDAVAATAVARRIGLPRRVVTILEGESLLNDATALVTLRTAVAALSGGVALAEVGIDFVRAAGGGVLIGVAFFLLVAWLRKRITDPLMDTAISFLTPFAAFVAAEEIHASGVISVVVAGLLLGHKAPIIQTAQSRITERITWRTVAFVLENTVFLLIGLQLDWILEDVSESTLSTGRIALVCLATLATVIVVRLVYMYVTWVLRRSNPIPPAWTFLIGWAGMRGVVTLAAAFVIPEDAPHREVLLLVAFTVVAGTLFLQGLSLPLMTRLLDVPPPDPAEDALARAALLQQAADAGLAKL
ncbi:sodium:proton antiporter, partial [Microbacterium sp. ARD31]|uniref:cation:proton antiporter n=1 Tax=Microbacterium sp. ARD31 TaxID=2962576 RepID=UPI002882AE00